MTELSSPAQPVAPLADLVRRRIEEMGWTLKTVAERSGLSIASVWALREGSRGKRPQPATLVRLAAGLDLPPERLFGVLESTASDDRHTREQAHLRIYRRLDDAGRAAVEALALQMLADHTLATTAGIARPRPAADADGTATAS